MMESPSQQRSSGNTWFWGLTHWLHPLITLGLLVCTILLFVQMQYLAVKLNKGESRIDALLEKVESQQQGQIQELSEKVEDNHNLTLYQMAGTFTLLAGMLTMFHMTTHLRNYTEPIVQRKIVAILWMSPIYGTTSFLSLIFPSADLMLAVFRDFYEAWVVYTFLSFLIAVLGRGDREAVVDVLSQHASHLKTPTRFLSRWYAEAPHVSDRAKANAVLTECQLLCMQFVFCRPLTSVARFVALTVQGDDVNEGWSYFWSPQFFISLVTNASVFLAFTGLLKFYHAVREDLLWCQPFSKFMSIKGIVFLTFWQGLLISIVVNLNYREEGTGSTSGVVMGTNSTVSSNVSSAASDTATSAKSAHEQAAEIQNVLICLEMLFFSIAHWCVFPSEEWEEGYRPQKLAKPSMGFSDFVQDVGDVFGSKRSGMQPLSDEEEPADGSLTLYKDQ